MRGRISPLLTSQLASPASSPLPSDVSSPPPTRPPSPPAPTSPSASPYQFIRRHHHQSNCQPSTSSSKGSELKDLLQKISQLPGVPTPPPSPAASNSNSNVSSNPPLAAPNSSPRDTPSPSTAASTPSIEIGSTSKKLARLAYKGLPIDVCRTHSLMHKSRYRSKKSYFQSLHFPRNRRKSLQYLRSPQSSSGSSTPQLPPQSFKNILMQSPQTVLQSPRSSNSSSQNLEIFVDTSKNYSVGQKSSAESPQTILQSPQTPQSPQSHLLSWSLSTPNLAVLSAPLMQCPFSHPSHYPSSTTNQYTQGGGPSSYHRHHRPFPYVREEPPLEAEEEDEQEEGSSEGGSQRQSYHPRYSLNTHQHFGDLQHLANIPPPPSVGSTGQFLPHYPQQTLPPINQNIVVVSESPQTSAAGGVGSAANLLKSNDLLEDEEDRHVYTNVDLPQRPKSKER